MNSAQQARPAQQAQSVCHPVNQGPATHLGYLQSSGGPAVPSAQQVQQAQQLQCAQQAQRALQEDRAAAQELLMLSRQAPCEPLARAQAFGQAGQPVYPQGLSPTPRAGSGQLEAAPLTPTLSPSFMGQAVPVNPLQFGRTGSDELIRAGSGQFTRAASDQLALNMRATSGRLSGQLPEPIIPPQLNMGRAGSCAASFLDPQASELETLQENMAAQLQQRSQSYPPPQCMQAVGPGINMANQQQQHQNGEAPAAVHALALYNFSSHNQSQCQRDS